MKKIPMGLLYLLFMSLMLNGCSGQSSSSDKNKNSALGKAVIVDSALPPPEARIVVAAMPDHREEEALVSIFDQPIDRKLLDLFAALYNYKVEIKLYPDDQAALTALKNGESHIAVGLSTAAETKTMRYGPEYAGSSAVIIHNGRSPKNAASNQPIACDETVRTSPEQAVRNFLTEQGASRPCAPIIEVGKTMAIIPMLEDLSNRQAAAAAVNHNMFELTKSFFPRTKTVQNLSKAFSYRWCWNSDNSELDLNIEKFWSLESVKPAIADYQDRVLGFLPKKVPDRQLAHLVATLEKELPKYKKVILEEAGRNNIDPLLLVALIYQESKFNSAAKNRNHYGLMQLSPRTASMFVSGKVTDPVANIQAGSRYLRHLWEDLAGLRLPAWDRWALSLIAYNQGPAGLNKKITRAQEKDCAVASWPEFKRLLPYLSKNPKVCGPVRSNAIEFVDSVQYYYFFLRGLVVLGRPESQHLGPGFETVPLGWPAP